MANNLDTMKLAKTDVPSIPVSEQVDGDHEERKRALVSEQNPVDTGDKPDDIHSHPIFAGGQTIGLISGDRPKFTSTLEGHQGMGEALKGLGLRFEATHGSYDGPEQSYIVYGPTREQLYQLGHDGGQESVVFLDGAGNKELMYTNGPRAGYWYPHTQGYDIFDSPPADYYTYLPQFRKYFRINFNDKVLKDPILKEPSLSHALKVRGLAAKTSAVPLKQSENLQSFPHDYPWHNSRTSLCRHSIGHGVFKKNLHDLTLLGGKDSPERRFESQDPSSYAATAVPFGSIRPESEPNLRHYPLHGRDEDIDQLVRNYGYQLHEVRGRPEPGRKNYDTKHLNIHPGDEYTTNWRKLHELAHALTLNKIEQHYGVGERVGKLADHRTVNDSLRTLAWEWDAAHRQRQLAQEIKADISDEDFGRELNTLMHESLHRVLTGDITEPAAARFHPNGHITPFATTAATVREYAHNLGLRSEHELLRKHEDNMGDEYTYTGQKVRQELGEIVNEKIRQYASDLIALRQRELSKAEKVEDDPSKCPRCKSSKTLCKCAVLPGDKPSKKIKAEGSGGKVTKGKTEKSEPVRKQFGLLDAAQKSDIISKAVPVPQAKPPTKNPMTTPTSQSGKPAMAKADFGAGDTGKPQTLPPPSPAPVAASKPAFTGKDLLAAKAKIGVAPKIPAAAAMPGTPVPAPALPKTLRGPMALAAAARMRAQSKPPMLATAKSEKADKIELKKMHGIETINRMNEAASKVSPNENIRNTCKICGKPKYGADYTWDGGIKKVCEHCESIIGRIRNLFNPISSEQRIANIYNTMTPIEGQPSRFDPKTGVETLPEDSTVKTEPTPDSQSTPKKKAVAALRARAKSRNKK